MTETAAHPVEIEGLRTRCGEAAGLEDIMLTVRAGEVFGLLGLRGAGKSSLLKTVLMLLEPAAGTVRLFGEPHLRAGARSRLAYLPERFQAPGHLSGHESSASRSLSTAARCAAPASLRSPRSWRSIRAR